MVAERADLDPGWVVSPLRLEIPYHHLCVAAAPGMVRWAYLLGSREALWLNRCGQRWPPPFPKPSSGVLGPDPSASSSACL